MRRGDDRAQIPTDRRDRTRRDGRRSPRRGARRLAAAPELQGEPDARAGFAALPAVAERKASYATWAKQLATTVYRDHGLALLRSPQHAAAGPMSAARQLYFWHNRKLGRPERSPCPGRCGTAFFNTKKDVSKILL